MSERDVAQIVLRTEFEDGYRYFIGRKRCGGYYEWIGGKREKGESIEETAERELREEIQIDWGKQSFSIEGRAEPYPSQVDPRFKLNPVLIEIGNEAADKITEDDLSSEHDAFEWIELTEFDEYRTPGQYQALERLDLVEGDVALAAVQNGEKYLVVKRSEENSSAGRWGFVSGKIEDGEDPEEAALRELKEETGVEADLVGVGNFYIGKGELGYWRLFPFLLETESKEVDLNWELSEYRWIDTEELEEMKTMGRMKAVEKLGLD